MSSSQEQCPHHNIPVPPVRTISSAEQLLRIELQELYGNLDRLKGCRRPVGDSVLPMNEAELMQYQYQYMCDYAHILRERIALFANITTSG